MFRIWYICDGLVIETVNTWSADQLKEHLNQIPLTDNEYIIYESA